MLSNAVQLVAELPFSVVPFKMLVTQSCLALCNPRDCSLPGSSVHGILQARILEWVVVPLSRGSSQPRDRTQVFRIAGRVFTSWATREAWESWIASCKSAKSEHSLIQYTKINWKWFRDLNKIHDTIKLLKENIGKIYLDINYSTIFLGQSPKRNKSKK